jgi:transcriptional regulator with XRE-family HTH domain
MKSTVDELKKLGIGKKIKALRENCGLNPDEVAESAGITRILLSQIEADAVPPMLATLLNIAKVLKVGIDHFFTESTTMEKLEFVPASRRLRVNTTNSPDAKIYAYSYESLAWRLRDKHMEPFFVEFDPEAAEEIAPSTHEGEEFIFVIEGIVECRIENRTVVLEAGDSLYFYSQLPHKLQARGPNKAKAVAVLYPFPYF